MLGLDPLRDGTELRQRVGAQLQESQFPDRIKVWEVLDLYSSFYRAPSGVAGTDRTARSVVPAGLAGRHAVGRSAATPVGRTGARRRSTDRRPRRAHHWTRPAGSARHLGPRRGDPSAWCHGRARHPLHGGGGAPSRPGGADRRRAAGRDRHPGRPRGEGRAGATRPVPAVGADRGCTAARTSTPSSASTTAPPQWRKPSERGLLTPGSRS